MVEGCSAQLVPDLLGFLALLQAVILDFLESLSRKSTRIRAVLLLTSVHCSPSRRIRCFPTDRSGAAGSGAMEG